MATFAGKMKILVPDQGATLTASGTLNGSATAQLPPGLLDCVVAYVFSAVAGATVTAIQLQGANASGGPWNNVAFDKGTFVAVGAGASFQVFHFAQCQFVFYRTQYTSGALTGGVVSAVMNFHPIEYSEQASIP